MSWRRQRICNTQADDRTVHWVHDRAGNTGKSFLVRFIMENYHACIVGERAVDMKHGVLSYIKLQEKQAKDRQEYDAALEYGPRAT